jgi:hypothetical protein
MTENVRTEAPENGVDMFDDAYLAWFDAENECERALRAWSAVARGDGNLAYPASFWGAGLPARTHGAVRSRGGTPPWHRARSRRRRAPEASASATWPTALG